MLLAPIFGWTDAGSAQNATMLLQIRLPRVICALVVVGALSVSGCTFQGLYKNAMASPDLLGATSGAGFGAALAVVLKLPLFGVQAAAFGMSLLAVMRCNTGLPRHPQEGGRRAHHDFGRHRHRRSFHDADW